MADMKFVTDADDYQYWGNTTGKYTDENGVLHDGDGGILSKWGIYPLHNFYGKNLEIQFSGEDVGPVFTFGDNVKIYGNDNRNDIDNHGRNVLIMSKGGPDSISNHSETENVTVDGGDGENHMLISGNNISVVGGVDNDYIQVGNDDFYNDTYKSRNFTINSGAGDDFVDIVSGAHITVDTDKGNDRIGVRVDNAANDAKIGEEGIHDLVLRTGYKEDGVIMPSSDDDTVNFEVVKESNIPVYDATIDTGDGNDVIEIKALNKKVHDILINAGLGNHTVKLNGVETATVNTGYGNDDIEIDESRHIEINVSDALEHNDIKILNSNEITVNGGNNSSDAVTVDGSDNVEIYAGEGNNFVVVGTEETKDDPVKRSKNITLKSGSGADDVLIWNGSDISLEAGDGDNTIINYGYKTFINVGKDNNSVLNGYYAQTEVIDEGNFATIKIGEGENTVVNYGANVLIDATEGKGIISNGVRLNKGVDGIITDVDINATRLAKYIYDLDGNHLTYAEGEKYVDGSYSTINAGDNDVFIANLGHDVIINAGNGKNSIESYGSYVTIESGKDDDYIISGLYKEDEDIALSNTISYIKTSYADIKSGKGKDTIKANLGLSATIDSGEDSDYVSVKGGLHDLIKTGSGSDVIFNESDFVTIDAGEDADLIMNYGDNAFISLGGGNDVVFTNMGVANTIIGDKNYEYIISAGHDERYYIETGNKNDVIILNRATTADVLAPFANFCLSELGIPVTFTGSIEMAKIGLTKNFRIQSS